MTEEINADYQDEITCPHCGHKDSDSWEHNLNDGDSEVIECDECEGLFEVCANISVTYSSEIITREELNLRAAKRVLSSARIVERITRKEYGRAGMPVDFQAPLIRANHDTCEAERVLEALKPRDDE